MATIFKAAVGDRLIAGSPCTGITLPKQDRGEIVPLSIEAVEGLAGAMPERYRALIVFAAGTGLRQGECFGRTLDRVDFLRQFVRVDRQLIDVKASVPQFGPPKSQAGFRTVPMPSVVTEALAAHLKQFGPAAHNLRYLRPLPQTGHSSARWEARRLWSRRREAR